MAGKGLKNDKQKASILGSIAGAQHVRLMAKHYGIPVIIHSDHCAKKLLEWFDGMIEADEAYFKVNFYHFLNLALCIVFFFLGTWRTSIFKPHVGLV